MDQQVLDDFINYYMGKIHDEMIVYTHSSNYFIGTYPQHFTTALDDHGRVLNDIMLLKSNREEYKAAINQEINPQHYAIPLAELVLDYH